MSDELKALEAEAHAADAEFIPAGEPEPGAAPAGGMDPTAEARALFDFAATLFFPIFPSLTTIYTDETRAALAGVSAPMMQKYGFTMRDFFAKWGAEINFAIVAFPLAIQTAAAIKADIAARKAENKKADNSGSRNQTAAVEEPTL